MWTSQNARAPIARGRVSTRRYLRVAFLVLFLGGCAGGLAERAVRSCPSSIPAPALEVGDTWNIQGEGGRNFYRRYVRRTDDGLFEREDRPGGAQLFYDDAHTLRKVFREGRWITEASLDYPDVGKPQLAFPLQAGKTWSDQVIARSGGTGNLIYHRTYTVLGCEQVTVPGGTFFAMVIEETQRPVGFTGGSRTWWYAPDVRYFVKLVHGSASHPGYWSSSSDWALTSFQIAGVPVSQPWDTSGFWPAPSTSPAPKTSPIETSVPIKVVGGTVFVQAAINESRLVPFVLDTGSQLTIVNRNLAQLLGVSAPPSAPKRELTVIGGKTITMPLVKLRSLKVGEFAVEDIVVGIYDAIPDFPEVAGLLGTDFLAHFRVTVDRQSERLTLVLPERKMPP